MPTRHFASSPAVIAIRTTGIQFAERFDFSANGLDQQPDSVREVRMILNQGDLGCGEGLAPHGLSHELNLKRVLIIDSRESGMEHRIVLS